MIFYQLGIFAAFYISLIIIIIWMYCKHQKEKKDLKIDSEIYSYSGVKRLMDKYEKPRAPQRTLRTSAGDNSSVTTETKLDNISSSRYGTGPFRNSSAMILLS